MLESYSLAKSTSFRERLKTGGLVIIKVLSLALVVKPLLARSRAFGKGLSLLKSLLLLLSIGLVLGGYRGSLNFRRGARIPIPTFIAI
jgi:hypothetical protein